MKLMLIVSSLATLMFIVACGKLHPPGLEVINPFDSAIAGKDFVIPRDTVATLARGEIVPGSAIKVEDIDGVIIPSQMDDLDGDGNWDELVFQSDFGPGEARAFRFTVVDSARMPSFPVRTNLNFVYAKPPHGNAYSELRLKTTDSPSATALFQMEGPGWENDLVGFRNYFDARNGIDIFGKRTPEMVLKHAGIDGQDYHVLDYWGMDILRVGASLGAGAIAIGVGDSLYRVGPAVEAGFRLLAEGPVRTVFELYFNGVPAGDRSYNVVHRISIYAGDHFYRSKVWIEGLVGDEVLYAGIVDLHGLEPFELTSATSRVIGTHGNQAFDGERLGLGIIVPQEQFVHLRAAPEAGNGIVSTHLVGIIPSATTPAMYAFFSGWEKQDSNFKEVGYFLDALANAGLELCTRSW